MIKTSTILDNGLSVREYLSSSVFEEFSVFAIENSGLNTEYDINIVIDPGGKKSLFKEDFIRNVSDNIYIDDFGIGAETQRGDLGPVFFISINEEKVRE